MALKEENLKSSEVDSEQKEEVSQDSSVKEESVAENKESAPAEPDWKDQYARLLADFDNFKKRVARDREDTLGAFCRGRRVLEHNIAQLPQSDRALLPLWRGNSRYADESRVPKYR